MAARGRGGGFATRQVLLTLYQPDTRHLAVYDADPMQVSSCARAHAPANRARSLSFEAAS